MNAEMAFYIEHELRDRGVRNIWCSRSEHTFRPS